MENSVVMHGSGSNLELKDFCNIEQVVYASKSGDSMIEFTFTLDLLLQY